MPEDPGGPTTLKPSTPSALERIVRDLLGRVTERVILCHSDLAVSGQEQTGPLLPLISANAREVDGSEQALTEFL